MDRDDRGNLREVVLRKMSWWAAAVIVIVLVLQSYWFIGVSNVKDLDAYIAGYGAVVEDKLKYQAISGATPGDSEIDVINRRETELANALQSAQESIHTWNRSWRWIVFWSRRDDVGPDIAMLIEQRNARASVNIFGLYLLPLLYGLLGALVNGMRRLSQDADRRGDGFDNLAATRTWTKIGMGLIAGSIVGMFISPGALGSLPAQTAPFALAFLAGYATDVFLVAIDRLADTLKAALSGKPAEATEQKDDAPRQGAKLLAGPPVARRPADAQAVPEG